jgi:hypothetical protein
VPMHCTQVQYQCVVRLKGKQLGLVLECLRVKKHWKPHALLGKQAFCLLSRHLRNVSYG